MIAVLGRKVTSRMSGNGVSKVGVEKLVLALTCSHKGDGV